jgi:hypothetical protein
MQIKTLGVKFIHFGRQLTSRDLYKLGVDKQSLHAFNSQMVDNNATYYMSHPITSLSNHVTKDKQFIIITKCSAGNASSSCSLIGPTLISTWPLWTRAIKLNNESLQFHMRYNVTIFFCRETLTLHADSQDHDWISWMILPEDERLQRIFIMYLFSLFQTRAGLFSILTILVSK